MPGTPLRSMTRSREAPFNIGLPDKALTCGTRGALLTALGKDRRMLVELTMVSSYFLTSFLLCVT